MNENAKRYTRPEIAGYRATVPQIDWREMLFAIQDSTGWSDTTIGQKCSVSHAAISQLKNERTANPSYLTGSKLLRMFLDLTDRDIPFLPS